MLAHFTLQRPNIIRGLTHKNWGLPKGGNTYGNGETVVPRTSLYSVVKRNRFLHTSMMELRIKTGPSGGKGGSNNPKKSNFTCSVGKLNSSNLDSHRLLEVIGSIENLNAAYGDIKSKPGIITPGPDGNTLDGMRKRKLKSISNKVLCGSYKFSPARRVLVPKLGKNGEFRPIDVSNINDKLVQKAIERVLMQIYGKIFSDRSHGFQPGKGAGTALHIAWKEIHSVTWFIDADVKKFFENVDHGILINILSMNINCGGTISLIRSLLKSGYVLDNKIIRRKIGIPQGTVIRPLLGNIYLHGFDLFMEDLIKKYSTSIKKRRTNSEYGKIQWKLRKKENIDKIEIKRLYVQLRKLPSYDIIDSRFRRIYYIRYADDFIVGITGPYRIAKIIYSQIESYLNRLKLRLHSDKSQIVHSSKEIKFLGALLRVRKTLEKKIISNKIGVRQRIKSDLGIRVNIPELIKKLEQKGFLRWRIGKRGIIRWNPTCFNPILNLDHRDILRYYNQRIRGIIARYSWADNRSSLGMVVHNLKYSCGLTLAKKYKLRTLSKAWNKFGRKITCPKTGTTLFIPQTFARLTDKKEKFPVSYCDVDKLLNQVWTKKYTRRNVGEACIVCGSDENVEIHHIRKIQNVLNQRKIEKIDWFKAQIIAIRRKQVPLCKIHHVKLHSNLITSDERSAFKSGCKRIIQRKILKRK